jgi:hypothetical protein
MALPSQPPGRCRVVHQTQIDEGFSSHHRRFARGEQNRLNQQENAVSGQMRAEHFAAADPPRVQRAPSYAHAPAFAAAFCLRR